MEEKQELTAITSSRQQINVDQKAKTELFTEMQEDDYAIVADRLSYQIGNKEYFSGTIECAHKDFYSSLTTSLIIYRCSQSSPLTKFNPISDIVPVWWEFHTSSPEGETSNDFSFSTLKDYLLV